MSMPNQSFYHVDLGETDRSLNPVQILAVGTIMAIGITTVVKTTGASWGAAAFAGWAGGILATFALAALAFVLSERLARRNADRVDAAALDALIGAWDDDLAKDAKCSEVIELKRSAVVGRTPGTYADWAELDERLQAS